MRKIPVWLSALALVVATFGAQAQPQPAQAQPAQPQPAQAVPPPPPSPGQAQTQPSPGARAERETACTGRVDEDGDGMVDCADADCFHDRACEAGGGEENNNARCSDWIDNDGDGQIDEGARAGKTCFSLAQSIRCASAGWSRRYSSTVLPAARAAARTSGRERAALELIR